jgi:superfamily II DNA or RNA helicase
VENLQFVQVRRERWRILEVRAYDACRLITLVNPSGSRRVLTPFDDIVGVERPTQPRRVTSQRWRKACRSLLAAQAPAGALRAAAAADLELFPHQLAPALAVLSGRATRLLLADDVGLGKTIQAGLIVAELLARAAVERVLILTPSGVRDQWNDELRSRFQIDAAVADARTLRQTVGVMPVGVNPWLMLPIAVASIDYVKRPEILAAVRAVRWDVVIVDEAHGAAGDSDRHAAVHALCAEAAYVLLLTATPHSGDERAFAAMCAIGTVRDPVADRLLTFRRTRRTIRGVHTRRVRTIHVRPTAAERRMHELLARYIRAVRREHGERALALSVLEKRALSAPWALGQSIGRRLASTGATAADAHEQLRLPLDDSGAASDEDAPPIWPADLALADAARDREWLERIRAAAVDAAPAASKIHAIRRLLRRVRESALVFTEYRDTAAHLVRLMPKGALLLHGGLDRRERAAVIAEFHRRPGTVLIATDAAGQGLNLHHTCRLVIDVELPWNPMRLEQRIGRVDRIGQRRTVHAVHLVAHSTGEARILARLRARVATARGVMDVADPVDNTSAPALHASEDGGLDSDSVREAARLSSVRRLQEGTASDTATDWALDRPLDARASRCRLRAALGGHDLWIHRISLLDQFGRPAETTVAAAAADGRIDESQCRTALGPFVARWSEETRTVWTSFWSARLARERAIAAHIGHATPMFQPALFDRRAIRANDRDLAVVRDRDQQSAERLAALAGRMTLDRPVVELMLRLRSR